MYSAGIFTPCRQPAVRSGVASLWLLGSSSSYCFSRSNGVCLHSKPHHVPILSLRPRLLRPSVVSHSLNEYTSTLRQSPRVNISGLKSISVHCCLGLNPHGRILTYARFVDQRPRPCWGPRCGAAKLQILEKFFHPSRTYWALLLPETHGWPVLGMCFWDSAV